MKKGYTEAKSFSVIEAQLAESFQKQRDSSILLHDIAASNRAVSYMDHYSQLAVVFI